MRPESSQLLAVDVLKSVEASLAGQRSSACTTFTIVELPKSRLASMLVANESFIGFVVIAVVSFVVLAFVESKFVRVSRKHKNLFRFPKG